MIEPSRYFEDLSVGEVHVSPPRTISQDEIVAFASEYDPQYFHTDPQEARRHARFGQVVASGIHILAVWRQLDHLITGDVRWICGIEWKNLRWKQPMRAGDEVRARAECVALRPSRSEPAQGIAEYRYSLLMADDSEIFWCLSVNLVERRDAA